MTQKVKLPMNV